MAASTRSSQLVSLFRNFFQTMTNDKRHHATVTMTEDLFRQVKERCKQEDTPLTVWVRNLIKKELRDNA